jgi:hypothetical protein
MSFDTIIAKTRQAIADDPGKAPPRRSRREPGVILVMTSMP